MANRSTGARAASGSRLAAGDTLQQLTGNVFQQAQPLLDRQRADIFGLLDRGTGIAGQQAGIETNASSNIANLLTGIGASDAGGVVGAANARQGGLGNLINLGGAIAGIPGVGGAIGGLFGGGRLQ